MSPLLLNYDTIAAIASELSMSGLLNLALTCRTMRRVIIPEFLYAKISLSLCNEATHQEFVRSFCRSIMADGSTAGNAVRSLDIYILHSYSREDANLVGQALEKMPYLHRAICSGVLDTYEPRIIRAIAAQVHLRHLVLFYPPPDALALLKDLGGLASIKIDGVFYHHPLSSDTPLRHLLSNSRHTLEELSLREVEWPLPSPQSNTTNDLVWPAVRTLDLGASVPEGVALDLAHYFPSTRVASLRMYPHPSEYGYPTRIESFTGGWEEYIGVVKAGSNPLFAHITSQHPLTSIEFASRLTPSLQSLIIMFTSGIELPLNLLEYVAERAPSLHIFYMAWRPKRTPDSNEYAKIIAQMASYLVRLPLRYLGLDIAIRYPFNLPEFKSAAHANLNMAAGGFVRQIRDKCPSIEAACIRLRHARHGSGVGKYWTRRARAIPHGEMPTQHLVEVSEEIGCADAAAYESYRWKA
ncbi:hypothetical protein BOTBODRAFT_54890 [Botryobasidium botryosum FD-172 SS1]|uniref:F-box domain-containing protein n=1 Tax=Botryobasidium botryosum (strain FD-172 SS1) TaxID=930990 RepID=A0A067MHH5_BOTB1|nr:hypothetical protein BOTBODRAFT_54890 [Botryobasidium botryosum FD-172 SS1]